MGTIREFLGMTSKSGFERFLMLALPEIMSIIRMLRQALHACNWDEDPHVNRNV